MTDRKEKGNMTNVFIVIVILVIGILIGMFILLFSFAFNSGNILENNGMMYQSNCLLLKEDTYCYNQTTLINGKIMDFKIICNNKGEEK